MSTCIGRNDPCPCGSGRKYKRCCLDSEGVTRTEPVSDGSPGLTLVVDAQDGWFAREVPNASPLRQVGTQGHAAEQATQDAAAIWGLPDFVYRADLRTVGSGVRELGDGIVIVGDLGIVVQVKSREAPSGDADRERRWVLKQTAKAFAQGNGTIRQLKLTPARMTNARGQTMQIDGTQFRWLVCTVIDHADAPTNVTPVLDGLPHPSVVLLRRDWEFLFTQLKSTQAVGAYLQRVAGEANELGNEPKRYYQYALADEKASPDPVDPALVGSDGRTLSAPLLPLKPAPATGTLAQRLFRIMLEDVALSPPGPDELHADRLRVLAELDRFPGAHRQALGEFLLQAFSEVATAAPDETIWRFRRLRGQFGRGPVLQLGFGVCSQYSEMHRDHFTGWVGYRHHQLHQLVDVPDDTMTVGVLLTRRTDGKRAWDTTTSAVTGAIDYEPDLLRALADLWN